MRFQARSRAALRQVGRGVAVALGACALACGPVEPIDYDPFPNQAAPARDAGGALGPGAPGTTIPTATPPAAPPAGATVTPPTASPPPPTPSDPTTPPPPPVIGGFTGVPVAEGCVDDVSAGDHVYTCEGLRVDATIPSLAQQCPPAGCGVILELHGDTGTGPLIDAHLRLRTRASARGYIVIAPTGPAIGRIGNTRFAGSGWGPADDAKLVAITQLFAKVFKADTKRIHATGFSRGGFATWRLACAQSTLFASVAPAAAGNANTFLAVNQLEPTCFQSGQVPARPISILTLMGKTDVPVPYGSMVAIKDAALTQYGITPADVTVVASDASFSHMKSTKPGAPIVEWFDHSYEVVPSGPVASAKGHCVPGSTYSTSAPQYAYACNPSPANAFDWGAEVLAFFERTPLP